MSFDSDISLPPAGESSNGDFNFDSFLDPADPQNLGLQVGFIKKIITDETPIILDREQFLAEHKFTLKDDAQEEPLPKSYVPVLYRIVKENKEEKIQLAANQRMVKQLESRNIMLQSKGKKPKIFESKSITIHTLSEEQYAKIHNIANQILKQQHSHKPDEKDKSLKRKKKLYEEKKILILSKDLQNPASISTEKVRSQMTESEKAINSFKKMIKEEENSINAKSQLEKQREQKKEKRIEKETGHEKILQLLIKLR